MAASTNLSKYKLNHSMIRVKDPKESVKFYQILGMTLVAKLEFPDNKFDLYFLGFDSVKAKSHGKSTFDREGLVELTHNYGTENDPEYHVNNGNMEHSMGFAYICITVDNLQSACQRLENEGYGFQQKATDTRSKDSTIVRDPDGYWIKLVPGDPSRHISETSGTDVSNYRLNHTMLRVKDGKKSLEFYQNVLGLRLLRTSENSPEGFDVYLLGYAADIHGASGIDGAEGLLGLMWKFGTEGQDDFQYHNGNDEPQGFGHICISVDRLDAACKRFESMNVAWKKRLTDGRMKNVAFLLDPDGYWIEVVQNERFTGKENF
ncbi:Glyoxalase/Bleomycin resistance protein/Dihydroxybiphenyl dioxygenase [Dactylonectria macrodidyma]|uniref:lactoylglutathione lyase n=1 Tax=Dactylonectria macrodidyma TaxID=307937 RepID=A0A9P9FUZ3_9HYPO|nr:Glyoxalase/Bleomycin resistance protein/Dihydroxybiphenyl dioxygenase [Dactylonectria macrodidyma]